MHFDTYMSSFDNNSDSDHEYSNESEAKEEFLHMVQTGVTITIEFY